MKRKNVLTSLAVASAVIAGVCLIPLPFHVDCAVEIQPQDAKQIFAMVPGRLVSWNKKLGDPVKAGETIAQLDSIDLRYQLAKYEGELALEKDRFDAYVQQKLWDTEARAQVETQREIVQSKMAMVASLREKMEMLNIVAKDDGGFCPHRTSRNRNPRSWKSSYRPGAAARFRRRIKTLFSRIPICSVMSVIPIEWKRYLLSTNTISI